MKRKKIIITAVSVGTIVATAASAYIVKRYVDKKLEELDNIEIYFDDY